MQFCYNLTHNLKYRAICYSADNPKKKQLWLVLYSADNFSTQTCSRKAQLREVYDNKYH